MAIERHNVAPAGLCFGWHSTTASYASLTYGYSHFATAWQEKTSVIPQPCKGNIIHNRMRSLRTYATAQYTDKPCKGDIIHNRMPAKRSLRLETRNVKQSPARAT